MKETAIEHYGNEPYITYCTSEAKWLNKLRKQMGIYPDDIKIMAENEDGSLVVRLPYSWFRAPQPPKKCAPMSEERKVKAAEYLAKGRASKKINSQT